MHKIALNKMEFFAFHGCYKEEQIVGNYFTIDLMLEVDCSKAAESDKIEDTVSYLEVYQEVKREMMIPSKLLEHVCKRILDAIQSRFDGIQYIHIEMAKMNPPLGGKVFSSSVSMGRRLG